MIEPQACGTSGPIRIFGRANEARRSAMICEEFGAGVELVFDAGGDESSLCAWLARSSAPEKNSDAAFFAWGPEKLNTLRYKGYLDLGARGYRLMSLISRRAIVAPDATIGVNTSVAAGALVEGGVEIADNCVIESGAILGAGVKIGHSCWIGVGAIVAPRVQIGRSTTLGSGVFVAEGIVIGEMCELLLPARYVHDIGNRTFFNPRFEDIVRVHRGPARAAQ